MNLRTLKFGTVKCYDSLAGSGWITPDDGSRDVAVRQAAVNRACLGQIARGQTLGFNISEQNRTAVDLWATWSNR